MDTPTITLFCSILEISASLFPVDIEESKTVGHLKEAIVKEKRHTYINVDPDVLKLWKLNDAIPSNSTDTFFEHLRLNPDLSLIAKELHPMSKLSSTFSEGEPKDEHLYIIVSDGISDSTNPQSVGQELYNALWGKTIETILTSAGPDNLSKYVSSQEIERLRLDRLNFHEKALLFRAEYDDAFETLTFRSNSTQRGGGVAVIGQPGIGKTSFLFYVLFHRLSKKLPTALQMDKELFYLFTKDGASTHASSSRGLNLFPSGTWALADSNATASAPCTAFLIAPTKDVWIVQATSPLKSRWHGWVKQRGASKYIMDVFPSTELCLLGEILGLDLDDLRLYHETCGPSARIPIRLARGVMSVSELENDATLAAREFVSDPAGVLKVIASLDATKVSHVLFALRPKIDDPRLPRAEIPTDYLRDCLVRAIGERDTIKQAQFFSNISAHPWFKNTDLEGYIYQKFVHPWLLASSDLIEGTPTHCDLDILHLPIRPKLIPLGGLSRLTNANKHKIPFYWRPVSQSFSPADAIICTKRHIIFIQSTINPATHDAKPEGITGVLDSLPVEFRDSRIHCLVFITNSDESVQSLKRRRFKGLKDIGIYYCVFKVGQSEWTEEKRRILIEVTVSR